MEKQAELTGAGTEQAPYVNPHRYKVTRLLETLERTGKSIECRNKSVQLEPLRLDYYSPEKEKLIKKEQRPWRYYPNDREPVQLLHPTHKYDEQRFVLEHEKVRMQSLQKRYEADESPTHSRKISQPYRSPRLRQRIVALAREQLEMRYVPTKFGRIPLDEQIDRLAYWDPQKREHLPKQFILALPHRIADSKRDPHVNYRKYHHRSHHTSTLQS